ncbi:hypothetical protein NDA01_21665 [Trichocoleus desertorum AS-A10]|uniref:hypothetical protein n=1 Tax=Trichocoleus desertorum TaxID=1481672 RepID=UPI003299E766
MNLNQYPQAIAQASTFVNDLESQINSLRQQIYEIEGRVDSQIAGGEFKNDLQRKAARFDLLQARSEYQDAIADLDQLKDAKAKAITKLELLRNGYSVAKIEARAAIVAQLAGLESREIVGL